MGALAPLPVALPLAIAAALLASAHVWPPPWADGIAGLTAAAVGIIAIFLAGAATAEPLVYWYGGWTPRQGVAIGIDFGHRSGRRWMCRADCRAVLCQLRLLLGLFRLGRHAFSRIDADLPGGTGGLRADRGPVQPVCLLRVMATVAFALTGYRLESSALEGALSFTVTNGIASFLMLAGIGVIYGCTGALNFAQLSHALAGHPADDLVMLAFVLLIGALFVKGAIIPFHFWIADAHAVAPTPVCVIFSGIMVPLGVFGAARLYWSIRAPGSIRRWCGRCWYGSAPLLRWRAAWSR
jgi:multicomponent Na+:H+ antiporter subunit D